MPTKAQSLVALCVLLGSLSIGSQVYYSDAMNQEISFQTSSLPAEVSTGGVRSNLPRGSSG